MRSSTDAMRSAPWTAVSTGSPTASPASFAARAPVRAEGAHRLGEQPGGERHQEGHAAFADHVGELHHDRPRRDAAGRAPGEDDGHERGEQDPETEGDEARHAAALQVERERGAGGEAEALVEAEQHQREEAGRPGQGREPRDHVGHEPQRDDVGGGAEEEPAQRAREPAPKARPGDVLVQRPRRAPAIPSHSTG